MARKRKNTRPRDTSANRAKKGKDKRYQRTGASNGSWKGGVSAHYYRRKAKAKPGQVVHHKNKDHDDMRESNLKAIGKGKTMKQRLKSAQAMHNKAHPEKGRKAARARKRR